MKKIDAQKIKSAFAGTEPLPDWLVEMFDRPVAPLDVLERRVGGWSRLSARERVRIVLSTDVLQKRTLGYFAADCAEKSMDASGRSEPEMIGAIQKLRDYADGQISAKELDVARLGACSVAAAAGFPVAHLVVIAAMNASNIAHGALSAAHLQSRLPVFGDETRDGIGLGNGPLLPREYKKAESGLNAVEIASFLIMQSADVPESHDPHPWHVKRLAALIRGGGRWLQDARSTQLSSNYYKYKP